MHLPGGARLFSKRRDDALHASRPRALDQYGDTGTQQAGGTIRQRIDAVEPLRTIAETIDRGARQRPDCEQPVDTGRANRCARLPMHALCVGAEFAHVAEHEDRGAIEAGEDGCRGDNARRVGVVAVIDQRGTVPAGHRGETPADGRHGLEAVRDDLWVDRQGSGNSCRGAGIADVVLTGERQTDVDAASLRQVQRKTGAGRLELDVCRVDVSRIVDAE